MSPSLDAFLRSWPYDPWLCVMLVASAATYLRGWRGLRRHDPERWHAGRPLAFVGGLLTIFLALASPIETFADLLLQIHMLQHLLLLMLAPPLIWLAAPLLPMLRGLPRPIRMVWVAPLVRSPAVREFFQTLTHPLVAWPLLVATMWLWHLPRAYDLALDNPAWHVAEHASFTLAALVFWYPVVAPFPSRPQWSRWIILPYLILADVQNTVLSAWLTFSPRPIYAHYTEVPRIGGWSALADQHAAGVLMWVPGSIAFLVPVFWIALKMLYGSERARSQPGARPAALAVLPVVAAGSPSCGSCATRRGGQANSGDLLRAPVLGTFLRHRHARLVLQTAMLALAVLVILDGLFGPQIGPANLAGVAPWIHWRGLVVLGLLVGGNFFCMACPFTLPRKVAGRWLPARLSWPRALRSKWLAVALLAVFLWSYEAFSLWDSPWLTAWIAIAYFVAAFVVDSLFRGAAFCKYVCPIGQFNFVHALVSPLEVGVREPAVCAACRTHECVRGSATAPGCGTGLFQPQKQGNLDCTFCLDCVQACPHENVGVFATLGSGQLADVQAFRSGIGRLSRRWDIAVLVLVLACGAFANAAGMVGPVVEWQDAWRRRLGNPPLVIIVSLYYLLALVVLPTVIVGGAAMLSRAAGRLDGTLRNVATRYAFALVPLGFSMWLAHHSFHLFTSYGTIVPVAQRMAIDFGLSSLATPEWRHACCAGVSDWIVRFELLSLDVGFLGSLLVGYRIASRDCPTARKTWLALAPWALLMLLLFALGVWIVLQPMQMRGTLPLSG